MVKLRGKWEELEAQVSCERIVPGRNESGLSNVLQLSLLITLRVPSTSLCIQPSLWESIAREWDDIDPHLFLFFVNNRVTAVCSRHCLLVFGRLVSFICLTGYRRVIRGSSSSSFYHHSRSLSFFTACLTDSLPTSCATINQPSKSWGPSLPGPLSLITPRWVSVAWWRESPIQLGCLPRQKYVAYAAG